MSDDEAPVGRGGKAEAPVTSENAMGPIYTMWENSLERLKVLNYDIDYCRKMSKKPLNRVHFVLPGANASHQFEDFMSICTWIIPIITGDSNSLKSEQYDDPNTKLNKLLLVLRNLDFRSSFPAQKLRAAHGEPACTVLDFLTERALAARGFEWASPLYPAADELEQVQGEDDEEEDIIEEDAAGAGPEEELLYEDTSRLESSLDNSMHNILQAQIDPLEWKTELERVGPKLSTAVVSTGNEWRAHVDQSLKGKEQVAKLMGSSKSDLNALNKQVSEELNQMRLKEKYLNNQYNTVCLEFIEVKHKLEELEKKSSSASEIVSKLNAELSEITEKLDDLKESIESKDSGMHDTSPLVKIKGALQQLKEEIHTYDMRIGVVSNTLLAARVGDHTRLRVKALHAAKKRQNKGKKAAADDHSVGSEDN